MDRVKERKRKRLSFCVCIREGVEEEVCNSALGFSAYDAAKCAIQLDALDLGWKE